MTLTSSGDATIGAVTNRSDGTYTATVTSSQTPGTQTITARATRAGASGTATLIQSFGALHVSGNQIVDAAGNPVVLKGIGLSSRYWPEWHLRELEQAGKR